MRQAEDTKTLELLPLERGPGRPCGKVPAMTAAERQARRRARLAKQGVGTFTCELPLDVMLAIDNFVKFKDLTKGAVIEKLVRSQLMRKR